MMTFFVVVFFGFCLFLSQFKFSLTVSICSGSLCLSVLHIRHFFSFGVVHHINVQQSVELHEFHIQSSSVCSLYVVLQDERMGGHYNAVALLLVTGTAHSRCKR